MRTIRVSAAEDADFHSIREALQSLMPGDPEPVTILLSPGTYREKVEVRRPDVTICGTGTPEETVIVYGDYALKMYDENRKYGTFRSYTFLLDGDRNTLRNLTVQNDSFPRKKVGQAVALYADGDGILVEKCHLESFQDTLFTGPLPPKAMSVGGFIGPKEFAPRVMGRHHYLHCRISGDVDFIFGSAVCYFEDCDIICRNGLTDADQAPETGVLGYATAASTPEGYPYGYVFARCRFLSDGCPAGSFYLGRPWRDYAKTVLIQCYLDAHIRKEGFHDWGKPQAHDTVLYAEYESSGPGASKKRADFVRILTEEEAAEYTKEKVLSEAALTGEKDG